MATTLLLNPFKFQNPNPDFPKSLYPRTAKFTCSSVTTQSQSAKEDLLSLISDQDRGLKTQNDPEKRTSIVKAIDAMATLGAGSVTTGNSLSATWRLLWTTEKEQLFIIEKAYLFGTQAGDVLQVIDVQNRTLNNVITFPPEGVFFVRSNIEIASSQRVNFRCIISGFVSRYIPAVSLHNFTQKHIRDKAVLMHGIGYFGNGFINQSAIYHLPFPCPLFLCWLVLILVVLDLLVQSYVGRTGKFRCRHLDRAGE